MTEDTIDALTIGDGQRRKVMVVESNTKAKEIKAFLGANWMVLPSNGFIKEIMQPKNVPQEKKREYGRYGISTTTFNELYSFVPRGYKTLEAIRNALQSNADLLVISTDPDRAGDAIGTQILLSLATDIRRLHIRVLRADWHEITKKAVLNGLRHASGVSAMVPGADADKARADYDRLFGYSVSPYLWKTVGAGTSGGRAQSPALRLIVDREKERMTFVSSSYYGIDGEFEVNDDICRASLTGIDGKKVAAGSSFDSDGHPKGDTVVLDGEAAARHLALMRKAKWRVADISERSYRRTPPKPYKTSTFQQDVGTRLGLSSKTLMGIAQKLFENAIITYLRTDAEVMSEDGVKASRTLAQRLYGQSSVPASPRVYTAKAGAQEGHEAIRPVIDDATGLFPSPTDIRGKLDGLDERAFRVYDLIYRRSIASQMNDATGKTVTITFDDDERVYAMTSVATRLDDPGFTVAMHDDKGVVIPDVHRGDGAVVRSMSAHEHKTNPPARYTEPQLVARLEELGIGRPATYAQIVSVNQERGYVNKRSKALYPTWRGMQVAAILEHKMASFVDYGYTAGMETKLDDIESRKMSSTDFLKAAWRDIDDNVNGLSSSIDWNEINGLGTFAIDKQFQVKCRRSGCWLEDITSPADDNGNRKGYKLDGSELYDGITPELCKEWMKHVVSTEPRKLGTLNDGAYKGYEVTIMHGRFGAYAHAVKGRQSVNMSLHDTMDENTVSIDDILPLFMETKLPRQLGEGYFVGIGKRGPWIGFSKYKKGRARFVSMPSTYDPRTISLDDAKSEFALASKNKPARKTTRTSKK